MKERRSASASGSFKGDPLKVDPWSETILAELERKAEMQQGSATCSEDSALSQEHQRCFAFVEQLTSPLRKLELSPFEPPNLPEYGPLEEIGRGGMGIVYRAQHRKTQRVDAIKVIRPEDAGLSRSQEELHRRAQFERESRLASQVSHENIVTVYQVGDTDGCLWFSMQHISGTSLHELIHTQPIRFEEGVLLIEKIARAIAVLHRHGILHGDIKPRNILIEKETFRPFITDFGLAELSQGGTASTKGVAGTFFYMAPELLAASKGEPSSESMSNVRTVASDIYSLGATLYAVLSAIARSRKGPHQHRASTSLSMLGNSRVEMGSKRIPRELLQICRQCMMHDPAMRLETAAEVARRLEQWRARPSWNHFFPGLGNMLWMMVAPGLAGSGWLVWGLMRSNASEFWIWTILFGGYVPLFASFAMAPSVASDALRARRELWSIWLGHFVAAAVSMISLRILAPDLTFAINLFYPCLAAISSAAFFAKSGNFWKLYRPIGLAWGIIAVTLALFPEFNAPIFGMLAAVTCVLIAFGDHAFWEG